MHYLLVSISHKNTDLAVREQLALDEALQQRLLATLCEQSAIREAAVVVTCNRVEVVTAVRDVHGASAAVFEALHRISGVDRLELEGRAQSFEDEGAVRHLFSVVSGLESVVVGEAQITGQIKEAFRFAEEHGFAGKRLTALSAHAQRCAAAIRSTTEVGKNPVSVSSAAVTQARLLLGGRLRGVEAIVVGNGEMARLAALHLLSNQARVTIVGRSADRARTLAEAIGKGAKWAGFDALGELINLHPLLFSATAAPHPVITADRIKPQPFDRLWFDIAVPRDIVDPGDERIQLYSVDDLQMIVQTNMTLREGEAAKAFRIVGEQVSEFYRWLQSLGAEPVIKALRQKAQEAVRTEIERAIKKGFIPQEHEANIRRLAHNAFKRFLHDHTLNLRRSMERSDSDEVLAMTRRLFELETPKGN